MDLRLWLPLCLLLGCGGSRAQEDLRATAVASYATHVHERYTAALGKAKAMHKSFERLVEEPSEMRLAEAKAAWTRARVPYLETEVFRFYNGPIDDDDGPEGHLNAWPLDEAYIDSVTGKPDSGIINRPEDFPEITPALLFNLNEREGEAHISSGYHALEFLLWGQDTFADSPGRRPASDFASPRRCAYLLAATKLLLQGLESLVGEWSPDRPGNYRATFLQDDPDRSLRKILQGMAMLAGFELASERLLVAYDTQSQEDEHSCFSDTTNLDIHHNLLGIQKVWTLLDPAISSMNEPLSIRTGERIKRALDLSASLPSPFDQAILGGDEAPGRRTILQLIETLEEAADLLEQLGDPLSSSHP